MTYTEELDKLDKELARIEKEISLCMFNDVIELGWKPMRDWRLKRIAEIKDIVVNEILFV